MKPPADINEALRDGGVPLCYTVAGLDWLDRQHQKLSRRSQEPRRSWHLAWAATYNDLKETLVQELHAAVRSERQQRR